MLTAINRFHILVLQPKEHTINTTPLFYVLLIKLSLTEKYLEKLAIFKIELGAVHKTGMIHSFRHRLLAN